MKFNFQSNKVYLPQWTQSKYTFYLSEAQSPSFEVGRTEAVDRDPAGSGSINYAITKVTIKFFYETNMKKWYKATDNCQFEPFRIQRWRFVETHFREMITIRFQFNQMELLFWTHLLIGRAHQNFSWKLQRRSATITWRRRASTSRSWFKMLMTMCQFLW